jgi:hypothetical protein
VEGAEGAEGCSGQDWLNGSLLAGGGHFLSCLCPAPNARAKEIVSSQKGGRGKPIEKRASHFLHAALTTGVGSFVCCKLPVRLLAACSAGVAAFYGCEDTCRQMF